MAASTKHDDHDHAGHDHDHDPKDDHAHGHGLGFYVAIWVGLLVLTVVTYLASRVEMGFWNVPIAVAIASTKAALVTWYFMHLYEQGAVPRLVVGVAGFFVAVLLLVCASDLTTRSTSRDFPLQTAGPEHGDIDPADPDRRPGNQPSTHTTDSPTHESGPAGAGH